MKRVLFLLGAFSIILTSLNAMDGALNEVPAIEDYKLFCIVQKIRDIVEESLDKNAVNHVVAFKGRGARPDPCYAYCKPTKTGINLTVCDDKPMTLRTPWGEITLAESWGSTTWGSSGGATKEHQQAVLKDLLSHTETRLLLEYEDAYCYNWKIYALLTVCGSALPDHVLYASWKDCPDTNLLFDKWKKLKQRYKREKKDIKS